MIRLQKYAVYLMIVSLPFNGLRPFLEVGELSREGFFYGSLLYLIILSSTVALGRNKLRISIPRLPFIQSTYIFLIFASVFLNLQIISSNSYGVRTGFERYIVSAMTYLYYLFLTCILYQHARSVGIERFTKWVAQAFAIVGAFLVLFCVVEVASWYVPAIRTLIGDFRALFASNATRAPFRLSGVSREPSFNAFALLACVPWAIYLGAATGRVGYRLLAAALLLLCVISGARTAYVGLAVMLVTYLLVRGPKLLPRGLDGAGLVLAAFALGVVVPVLAFANIGVESSTSDVTRGYLTMRAVEAGIDTFWGQGFGQAAFFVVKQASSGLQYSWELANYYQGDAHGDLPPLFSWYARTMGEFGIVGYVIMALAFAFAVRRIFRFGHSATEPFSINLFLVVALLIAQFLAIAFSIDSVRVPQFWLAWLFGGLLVTHMRLQQRLPAAGGAQPVAVHG